MQSRNDGFPAVEGENATAGKPSLLEHMRALSECRLYGIIDLSYVARSDVARVAEQMVEGGTDLIQLRGKARSIGELVDLAAELHQLTTKSSTPLIVNDHAEIASRIPVEGVHVGQDDDSIEVARTRSRSPNRGRKSAAQLEQALTAQREGAATSALVEIFRHAHKTWLSADRPRAAWAPVYAEVSVPIFCIGGINIDNLPSVIDAGAKRVVMVSALLNAHSIVDYARCATDMLA